MARTIAGQLALPDGTALANARIHFTAKRNEATLIVEGVSASFSTNSSGNYSQSIEGGYYAVSVTYAAVPGTKPRRWNLGNVWVEDGDPVTLNALLSLNQSAADPANAALLQLLADAQQARDEAVQAAQDAGDAVDLIESQKGQPDGIATLDENGIVPKEQLPRSGLEMLSKDLPMPTLYLPFVSDVGVDPLANVTRASGGGRFNEFGQYEWVPANTPRIDYDPVTGICRGILIEEQRTNLLTRSEAIENWNTSGSPEILPVYVVSPRGDETARVMKTDGSAGTHGKWSSAGSDLPLGKVVYSLFLKGVTENARIRMNVLGSGVDAGPSAIVNLDTGEVTGSGAVQVVPLPNGWWWVAIEGEVTGPGTVNAVCYAPAVEGPAQEVAVWGAQLEQGSSPTSYIPTEGSQVTRAADIASVVELSPWFNPNEGTIFVDAETASAGFALTIYSTASNAMSIPYGPTGGPAAQFVTGGVAKTLGTRAASGKVAVSYSPSGAAVCVNGGAVVERSDIVMPPVSALRIGARYDGEFQFNGHLRSITYYPKALSTEQLQELTK